MSRRSVRRYVLLMVGILSRHACEHVELLSVLSRGLAANLSKLIGVRWNVTMNLRPPMLKVMLMCLVFPNSSCIAFSIFWLLHFIELSSYDHRSPVGYASQQVRSDAWSCKDCTICELLIFNVSRCALILYVGSCMNTRMVSYVAASSALQDLDAIIGSYHLHIIVHSGFALFS